jgi:hypothetical protein
MFSSLRAELVEKCICSDCGSLQTEIYCDSKAGAVEELMGEGTACNRLVRLNTNAHLLYVGRPIEAICAQSAECRATIVGHFAARG